VLRRGTPGPTAHYPISGRFGRSRDGVNFPTPEKHAGARYGISLRGQHYRWALAHPVRPRRARLAKEGTRDSAWQAGARRTVARTADPQPSRPKSERNSVAVRRIPKRLAGPSKARDRQLAPVFCVDLMRRIEFTLRAQALQQRAWHPRGRERD
jgi:hypothetical protein